MSIKNAPESLLRMAGRLLHNWLVHAFRDCSVFVLNELERSRARELELQRLLHQGGGDGSGQGQLQGLDAAQQVNRLKGQLSGAENKAARLQIEAKELKEKLALSEQAAKGSVPGGAEQKLQKLQSENAKLKLKIQQQSQHIKKQEALVIDLEKRASVEGSPVLQDLLRAEQKKGDEERKEFGAILDEMAARAEAAEAEVATLLDRIHQVEEQKEQSEAGRLRQQQNARAEIDEAALKLEASLRAQQAQPPEPMPAPAPEHEEQIAKARGWARVKQQMGVHLEGFLLKQNSTSSFNPGKWQKRKFLLTQGNLSYFDANNELTKASYSVTDIKNMRLIKKGETIMIEISMEERVLRVSSAMKEFKKAEKEMHRWGSAIRQAINLEVGQDTEPQEAKEAVKRGLYSPEVPSVQEAATGPSNPPTATPDTDAAGDENVAQEAELKAYLETAAVDSQVPDESDEARKKAIQKRKEAMAAHRQGR